MEQKAILELLLTCLTGESIYCNGAVGVFLTSSYEFRRVTPAAVKLAESIQYIVGEYNGCHIYVDQDKQWQDLTITDADGRVLLNLRDHGITPNDLI